MSNRIKLDGITTDQILNRYSSGETGRAIAKGLGLSHHTVFKVLKQFGRTRPPVAPQQKHRRIDPTIVAARWAGFGIGDVVGRLTITGPRIMKAKQSWFPCRCKCGSCFLVRAISLKNRHVRSCGCLKREVASVLQSALKTKHGQASKRRTGTDTPEYRAWCAMNRRCYSPNSTRYAQWGGRGITVCPQWRGANGFAQFFADMGRKPSPSHSIDRIDNDGNYEPGNVRWATKKEQSRNRRNVGK